MTLFGPIFSQEGWTNTPKRLYMKSIRFNLQKIILEQFFYRIDISLTQGSRFQNQCSRICQRNCVGSHKITINWYFWILRSQFFLIVLIFFLGILLEPKFEVWTMGTVNVFWMWSGNPYFCLYITFLSFISEKKCIQLVRNNSKIYFCLFKKSFQMN